MSLVAAVLLSLAVTLTCGLDLHKSTEFGYYVFAQEYPASVCQLQGKECSYPSNASCWTIHGLWPSQTGSTLKPCFCMQKDSDHSCNKKRNVCEYEDGSFDPEEIQTLVPMLVANWTNLLTNRGFFHFWCHEYLKHGTCTGMTEKEYFTTGLALFNLWIGSFGEVLRQGGILPGKTPHAAAEIQRVLTSYYKVTPILNCERVKHTRRSRNLLTGIKLCLNKHLFPMECPEGGHFHDNCHGKVFYPESNSKC